MKRYFFITFVLLQFSGSCAASDGSAKRAVSKINNNDKKAFNERSRRLDLGIRIGNGLLALARFAEPISSPSYGCDEVTIFCSEVLPKMVEVPILSFNSCIRHDKLYEDARVVTNFIPFASYSVLSFYSACIHDFPAAAWYASGAVWYAVNMADTKDLVCLQDVCKGKIKAWNKSICAKLMQFRNRNQQSTTQDKPLKVSEKMRDKVTISTELHKEKKCA